MTCSLYYGFYNCLLHYIVGNLVLAGISSRQKIFLPISNSISRPLHLVFQKGQKKVPRDRLKDLYSYHTENMINYRLQWFCHRKVITQKRGHIGCPLLPTKGVVSKYKESPINEEK